MNTTEDREIARLLKKWSSVDIDAMDFTGIDAELARASMMCSKNKNWTKLADVKNDISLAVSTMSENI